MHKTDFLPFEGAGLSDFAFPSDAALFVIGDVHGQADTLERLLLGIAATPTPGLRRVCVFLGDLIDRGPDSLNSLTIAYQARERGAFDEVHYLPGNHELMLAGALDDLSKNEAGCWAANGGHAVLAEINAMLGFDLLAATPQDQIERALDDALPALDETGFQAMVRSWPSHYRMGDVLCVHAGIDPRKPAEATLGLSQQSHFDAATNKVHWAWIRDSFLSWQGGFRDEAGRGLLVLHGHTMAPKATAERLRNADRLEEIFSRIGTNSRVCLDGAAAAATSVTAALVTERGVRILNETVVPPYLD